MRPEKIQMLNDVRGMLKEADYVYFITYKGITVSQFKQLRKDLQGCNASCHVIKNTLLRKTFAEMGHSQISENPLLKLDTAVVYGKGDAGAPAKVIDTFAKGNDKVAAKFGMAEKQYMDAATVKVLAELPSRDALYAQFVGVLNQAVAGIVNVLDAYKKTLSDENQD